MGREVVFASAGYDHTVRFWDAGSGSPVGAMQHNESHVNAMALSADRRTLAVAGCPGVRIYDAARILAAMRPRDGSPLAVAGAPLHVLETGGGNAVALGFLGAGRRLWTANEDGSLRVWDTMALLQRGDGLPEREFCVLDSGSAEGGGAPGKQAVTCAALSPDEALLVVGDDAGGLCVWGMKRGTRTLRLLTVDIVRVTPGVAASVPAGGQTLWPRALAIRSVAVSRDSAYCAAVDDGGTLHVIGLRDAARHAVAAHPGSRGLRVVFGPPVSASLCAESQRHESLLTAGADGMARLWALVPPEDGPGAGLRLELLRVLQGHGAWVWDAAFSADGAFAATASSDGTVRVWSTATGDCVSVLSGHSKAVVALVLNDSP